MMYWAIGSTVVGIGIVTAYFVIIDNRMMIQENRELMGELRQVFAGIQATPARVEPIKWTDPETGCIYYYVRGIGGGIRGFSVRHRADGTPDCPKVGTDPL
jgi:hypothetical protein